VPRDVEGHRVRRPRRALQPRTAAGRQPRIWDLILIRHIRRMRSCSKSDRRRAARPDEGDRGCPLATLSVRPIWHASGTTLEPRGRVAWKVPESDGGRGRNLGERLTVGPCISVQQNGLAADEIDFPGRKSPLGLDSFLGAIT
jgi:hypothetical protein